MPLSQPLPGKPTSESGWEFADDCARYLANNPSLKIMYREQVGFKFDPTPQERPRGNKWGTYSPKNEMRIFLKKHWPFRFRPIEAPICIVEFVFSGQTRRFHTADVDNLAKGFLDALVDTNMIHDDKTIKALFVSKVLEKKSGLRFYLCRKKRIKARRRAVRSGT